MGNLEFQQTNAWANPAERIQGIQDQGIKLIPITEPMMTSLSFNASEVLDQGLVGVRPDGTTPYQVPNLTWITSAPVYLLDFTKAEMRAWWIEKHQKLIQDYGFDGFWQDLNEPEAQPLDMVYDGGTAVEVHNVIGQQMNRALDEAMQVYRPGGRTFIMSRSGFPGMQRYGAGVWSGDVFAGWNDLAGQVPLAASMGLAGVPYWNSDIGGFTGFLSPELYLRWCQFGFFNPIYRPHASNAPREPWAFGQDVEDAVADLLRLRYRLIPHYYTVAREAYDSGAPIMRPLVMDYPGDLNVENLTTQFLYGDYLMAAPITQEGATSKEIYLPDATWYDWFRHTRYDGAQTLQYAVDSDDFPLLVRAPAIIPLGPVMETSDEAPLTTVALRVYLPTDVSATSGYLYEDDGLTTGYRVGEFATTQFTATRTTETQVTVTVTPAAGDFTGQVTERVWQVELYDSDEVLVVQANDNSLEMQPDLTTLNNSTSGWFYDSANRITHAKLSISSTSTTQTINFFEEIPADDSTNYIKLF
jgi:alpha-glucosidase (family GH31 glycosyl hydrolase)